MKEYPKVDYPTVIEGKIYAQSIRFETIGAEELFLDRLHPLVRNKWAGDHFHLENFGPIQYDGKTWGVTHMQKQSKKGYLKMSPDCFHWWYFLRQQKKNSEGGYIPGSELGKYFRWGTWRWDAEGTNGKHWMGPGSYYINFSLHWD